jgi:hypothetical protein
MSDAPKDEILSLHVYQASAEYLESVPGNYLEIGVFNGIGTATIAELFPDKKIYAIDPFIEDGHTGTGDRGIALNPQREAYYENAEGKDNMTIFETTSDEFAKTLTDEKIAEYNIDWVVVDGSHHYEDVTVDYHLAMRLIGDRPGVIVFDDLGHSGVQQAVDEFLIEYKDQIGMSGHIAGGAALIAHVNTPVAK